MNRRLLPLALILLIGCTTSAGLSPANIATAQTWATGLGQVVALVSSDFPTLIPPSAAATIESDLAAAQSAASLLSTLPTSGTLASEVSAGVQVVNLLAARLPAGTLPKSVMDGMAAATLLAQTLAALVPAGPTVGAVPINTRFLDPGMTVEQAKAVLGSVGRRARS
jgi:hypothetical protein